MTNTSQPRTFSPICTKISPAPSREAQLVRGVQTSHAGVVGEHDRRRTVREALGRAHGKRHAQVVGDLLRKLRVGRARNQANRGVVAGHRGVCAPLARGRRLARSIYPHGRYGTARLSACGGCARSDLDFQCAPGMRNGAVSG